MSNSPASNQRSQTSSSDRLRSQRSLTPGTVLENRYQIQRIVGRGGMSTVYAARDLRFGQVERITAIKEMVDEDPDPGTRALRLVNFERESALLATITHPAVPKIYDYFSHGGLVYLVLEYVDGQDLERALLARQKPFPEDLLVKWTLEICDVLETLHNQEPDPIIFRDLKPSNIMLRKNGRIALIDFGIARVFHGNQRGTMIGTEGYAPPEQYRGIADVRGDIYALGATLHHLATASDPRQETPFTFHERPVRSLNPNVSDDFAAVINRMVSYHPDQRYQSVEEIEADVARLGDSRASISGRGQGLAETEGMVDEASQDNSASAGTTVFSGAIPSSRLPVRRFSRRRSSRKRMSRSRAARNEGERVAWSVQTGDEVRGSASFANGLVYIGSYDCNLYALDPEDGEVAWKFQSGGGVVSRPLVVDETVIFGAEDGLVYGVDAETGAMRWSCRTGRAVRSSPRLIDGNVIIGSDDGQIYALEPETGDIVWRHRAWAPVRSSATAARELLVIGSDDGTLYALRPEDGTVAWKQHCGGPVRAIPAIDGERIVVPSWSGLINSFTSSKGVRAWQQHLGSQVAASPAVREGTIVLGMADGALLGLQSSDGSTRWTIRYANQITSTALLGETVGVVGTIDGDCLAFRIEDGELVWKHHIASAIVSTPTRAEDTIIIGSLDGSIYGIRLHEDEALDLERGES